MLVRPITYPDEMDRGYFGRVLRLNGLPTRDLQTGVRHIRSMLSDSAPFGRGVVPTVDVLAFSAGMEVDRFIVSHTLLPWRQILAHRLPTESWRHVSTRATVQTLLRPGAALCRSCVEEDIGFHGISYWRRSHQLRGAVNCEKHGQRLVRLADERFFLKPPSSFAGEQGPQPDGDERPAVRRFNQLLWELGASGLSINASVVATNLKRLAIERGYLRMRSQGATGTLFAGLDAACGREWLLEVAPVLARNKASCDRAFQAFLITNRLPTLFCYLLLIAFLSEDEDVAWKIVMEAASKMPRMGQRSLAQCHGW